MKVLHISTFETECGIADYFGYYLDELNNLGVENDIFKIDPKKIERMNSNEILKYYENGIKNIDNYDIIHIQHEYSFFTTITKNNFKPTLLFKGINVLKSLKIFHDFLGKLTDKTVFVTFHSPAPFPFKNSLFNFIFRNYNYAKYFQKATKFLALVHTELNKKEQMDIGVCEDNLKVLRHPIKSFISNNSINQNLKENISQKLSLNENSIVLSMVGFIGKYKGYDVLLDLLKELPENYKALILGGPHPINIKPYEKFKKKVKDYSLEDRIFITGFYEEDDLNTYFDLVDIFLAPYSNTFTNGSGALNVAISSLKPVIVYNIPSFEEINSKFEPLILVEYENKQQMKEKIINIIKNQDIVEYHRKQAENYLNDMSYQKIAKKLLDFYEDYI
ncbi:MAG: glycosyltransferase [Methanobrevibacter sp.]|jgi:glycosyltransferase involved in cell wall biosynthesis|nr:glycosyltransferase [Candidatus Methanoflexus mossambicus]